MIVKKRLLLVGVLMSVMLMASFACGDEEEVVPEPAAVEVVEEVVAEEPAQTVVDIAVADGRFTTLVTALGAADLVGVLSGEG
ncbi:MAG: fasciclin domain-containing protein, partial [Dehalococcoidia bacterium]